MDQYFHSSATHLSPFYHCTTKVMLELHTLPVYCSCEDYALELHTVANSFIYNDCRTLVLGNRSIQTFTISKTFFLLLLHLARHIACDVAYCVMEPESVIHIPVKTLVDCYYFNLKYSKEIEWLEIERLAKQFHVVEAIQFSLKALSQFTSYDFISSAGFDSLDSDDASTTFQSVYRQLNKEDFIELYLKRNDPSYVRQVYWSREFRPSQLPASNESTSHHQTFYLSDVFTCLCGNHIEHDIPYVSKPTHNKKITVFAIEAKKYSLHLHICFPRPILNRGPLTMSLYIDLIDYKTAVNNIFATTVSTSLFLDCFGNVLYINALPGDNYDKRLVEANITDQFKEDLTIDVQIPYSALYLFSKSPKRIFYNIELLQKDIGAHYFQSMRTWDNTPLFDYTTMNVLEVPD